MNEEEKKAIEELKNFKKDKDCKFWIGLNGEKAIEIILKLIEKQQKEINILKESQFVLYGHDGNIAGCIRLGNDVVSKDKIKEKIKYYHKQREKAETEKINDMYVNYIDCLEELLRG